MGNVIQLQSYLQSKSTLTSVERRFLAETPPKIDQIATIGENIAHWVGRETEGVEGATSTIYKLQLANCTLHKEVIAQAIDYFGPKAENDGSASARVVEQLKSAAQTVDEKIIPLNRYIKSEKQAVAKATQASKRQSQVSLLADARMERAAKVVGVSVDPENRLDRFSPLREAA